ncbi:MAG: hypothetical protein H0Z24_10655 [Thermosipho sp. (in: Bacteria)]|nr:hypothetical protein [Thermosipho sp. (in: thermotogales)]
MKNKLLITAFSILGILLLTSCNILNHFFPAYSVEDIRISKDTYRIAISPINIKKTSNLKIEVTFLKEWQANYGLEIILLDEDEFNNFIKDKPFSTDYHYSIFVSGTYQINFDKVLKGTYYLVIDNSIKGWEKPNSSSQENEAILNIKIFIN